MTEKDTLVNFYEGFTDEDVAILIIVINLHGNAHATPVQRATLPFVGRHYAAMCLNRELETRARRETLPKKRMYELYDLLNAEPEYLEITHVGSSTREFVRTR